MEISIEQFAEMVIKYLEHEDTTGKSASVLGHVTRALLRDVGGDNLCAKYMETTEALVRERISSMDMERLDA